MSALRELAIPLLTGVSIVTLGSAVLVARHARTDPIRARLRELQKQYVDHRAQAEEQSGIRPDDKPLTSMLDRIGGALFRRNSSTLQQQLAHAGFHHRAAPTIFMGTKVLLLLVGILVSSATMLLLDMQASHKLATVLSVSALLFFAPNIVVSRARAKRREQIRVFLPDAIDLLEICVSSGMGLDQAWNSVGDEVRGVSPTLADEMALTELEMHLGASRTAAMRHMAQRTDSEDLGSLVSILVQSDRFGTSVAEALRTFASSLREQRSQRAQEYAEKMAVKLILPMVLCIFPAMMIVLGGPGFLVLMNVLGGE